MYDRNHYFGVGPIPNPKTKLAILLADTVTDTKTTFQRENLVTNSMGYFSIIKGPLKSNLLPNIHICYFIFEDLCSISSFKFQKKNSALRPMPKLDLSFG